MRVMLFMKPNIQDEQWMPSAEAVAAMSDYNEQLAKAGVLLALDGLTPPSNGVQVTFHGGGKPTITDGPFAEAKELIGGYWILDVKSKEEAVEWATRCPVGESNATIEVRPIAELSDFPEEVRAAAKQVL